MATRAAVSAIRYGYGFAPGWLPPTDPAALLETVARPDPAEQRHAGPSRTERLDLIAAFRAARREGGDAERLRAQRAVAALRVPDARVHLLRPLASAHGLRERLVAFWADHFSLQAKNVVLRALAPAFREEAVRPHLAARFADMLKAVVRHPAMLLYLDQVASVGPNSRAGKRRGRGLNENLAREILELHTLGVDAGYAQADVAEFAELLTGLSIDAEGFRFRPGLAEPGAEIVLGRRYGGGPPAMADIDAALEDLARHPATARHLARKLAVHFLGQAPAPLVAAMAEAYLARDGSLAALHGALLEHPAAWAPLGAKVKTPHEFVVSSLRALAVAPERVAALDRRGLDRLLIGPLRAMGQPLARPPGPDGWPEDPAHWITAPALAARIDWAAGLAERVGERLDPRRVLAEALPGLASPALRFLVEGAESRQAGLTLVLASAEFNRR